jgi:hypothetical protein
MLDGQLRTRRRLRTKARVQTSRLPAWLPLQHIHTTVLLHRCPASRFRGRALCAACASFDRALDAPGSAARPSSSSPVLRALLLATSQRARMPPAYVRRFRRRARAGAAALSSPQAVLFVQRLSPVSIALCTPLSSSIQPRPRRPPGPTPRPFAPSPAPTDHHGSRPAHQGAPWGPRGGAGEVHAGGAGGARAPDVIA